MYNVNDIVVYKNGGVCRVEEIGTPAFMNTGEDYYKLRSLVYEGSIVYVKVGPSMRRIISAEQAGGFLKGQYKIKSCYHKDYKVREREFREMVNSCELENWLEMLKGICSERTRRSTEGKHLKESDKRFLSRVEGLVGSEFSAALGISKDEATEQVEKVLMAQGNV